MHQFIMNWQHNIKNIQWNLCIMDTLGPTKRCPDFPGQFNLYDKASFGIITKCVDYAGAQVSWLTGFTVHM